MDEPAWRMRVERLGIEEELKRCYVARLCDWTEPGVVKVYRDGRLLGPHGCGSRGQKRWRSAGRVGR